MQRPLAALLALCLPACGGGSSPSASTPQPAPTPVPTPTPDPHAKFGAGQYLVNSKIAPGRYFSDPPGTGCYWERESGVGGTLAEIIANDVFTYDPKQVIVDILPSDYAFKTDADCGTWYDTPRQPAQINITPGIWLVGGQIAPGTYQANVGSGCYWERLRDFEGRVSSIISNDFVASASPQLVQIRDGDVGFSSDGDCGTWARANGAATAQTASAASPTQIERAWRQHRSKTGVR